MSFNIGLSGLYAANKSLDVTGNNIANVATTGFKSSRIEFADQYAQSIRGTSGGTGVGSGVTTAAVSQQFSQGSLSTGTGNALDLAINGNGFFMLNNNGESLYTRAGAFHTDKDGYVVNSSGMNLQGYNVDANGTVMVGASGDLRVDSSNQLASPTSIITNTANLNSTSAVPTVTPFDATNSKTYNDTYSTTVFDSQGNEHRMESYFAKTGTNSWTMYSLIDGRNISDPTSTVPDANNLTFDSSGSLIINTATTPTSPSPSANLAVNADGTFKVVNWVPAIQTGTGTTATWGPNGAAGVASGIQLDMKASTQTASATGRSAQAQNGYAAGQIKDMSVDSSGNLFASYTNGQSKVIGQVSLTSFANVQGLAPAGGTNWRETFSSGIPGTGTPQSGTLGYVTGQALEESNVDLTLELVNLIKAQSNYQANAKTISTQSTIMQTTIQMT
ncbi:flagellar hook protein FlgE [Pseudomonas syringae]|uniref:Flagellar hook protein FlgE n=7 Tax=Pseudomonas syringae TaxID=317 RepID=A0A9Q4A4H9_PSESX|nr:flagellar hook protein FlgE [Pseudomonas syringae]MCF5469239.1 flagellar hook-basal body complex protein [Pseudomonas syringae]MCF5475482.1 flagellar hook-basal body complex protein [Pseudomonas syringae]MCF5485374.1 flagellar hook-basal body complex protein [Pseudomonas syringae]MCF5489950.1 flagellar hook-basal body complex protein [Pseudomonas syringae]MCF5493578.1 flagellar hook-basal body complex protein [Pseudomonas syringae]